METLRSTAQRVRESLFFLPLLLMGLGAVGAVAAMYLDDHSDLSGLPILVTVSVAGGRALAATVAGATITVAAIVFSITALSSQIAVTQYSPRAVAGFFENRFQQIIIGLVVGTFVYSLFVLAGLSGDSGSGDDPRRMLAVTVNVTLGVASVIGIVGYLDHSLRRLRVGNVVRRIAEQTVESVRRQRAADGGPADETAERVRPEGEPARVTSSRTGWVRSIDADGLARTLQSGEMARIEVRVGEFVSSGDLLATLWKAPGGADVEDPSRVVGKAVHIGRERDVLRDPSYGMRQLVDIALRALSPGVNDPTTAVDVLQHMKLPLREVVMLEAPRRVYVGPDGQRVFLPEEPSRSDHVHEALSEIRLAGSDQPAVLRTILEILTDLIIELAAADLDGRAGALLEEAVLTAEAAQRSGFPEKDRIRILAAAKALDLGTASESAAEDKT